MLIQENNVVHTTVNSKVQLAKNLVTVGIPSSQRRCPKVLWDEPDEFWEVSLCAFSTFLPNSTLGPQDSVHGFTSCFFGLIEDRGFCVSTLDTNFLSKTSLHYKAKYGSSIIITRNQLIVHSGAVRMYLRIRNVVLLVRVFSILAGVGLVKGEDASARAGASKTSLEVLITRAFNIAVEEGA